MKDAAIKHWGRLTRSVGRRITALVMFFRGYRRLGSRYGGWWVNVSVVGKQPLLIDCGLGEDISFPIEFLKLFGGHAVGVEANPKSLLYCGTRAPKDMEIWHKAFWFKAGETVSFFVPTKAEHVSGSLVKDHAYVGESKIDLITTNLTEILESQGRESCDVLKLDVEGAEYRVLDDLCQSGEIKRVRQLLVEYHHFCTGYSIDDTLASVQMICGAGFALMHVEGRNYVFMRIGADK